jgi:hypothetical protein
MAHTQCAEMGCQVIAKEFALNEMPEPSPEQYHSPQPIAVINCPAVQGSREFAFLR